MYKRQELVLRGVTGGTLRVEERAVRFEDVPESFWGAGDIAFAAARELLQGTGLAEFSPEEHLTRAMLMTVLARICLLYTSLCGIRRGI